MSPRKFFIASAALSIAGSCINVSAATFYWNGTSDVKLTASWGANSDGSGSAPGSFGSGNVFRIDSGNADVTGWTVSNAVIGANGAANATGSYSSAGLSFESGSLFTFSGTSGSFRESLTYANLSLASSTLDATPGSVVTTGTLRILSNEVNVSTSSTSRTWSIGQNVVLDAGSKLDLINSSSSSSSTVNLSGTLTNSGTIKQSSAGAAVINFVGSGSAAVGWGQNSGSFDVTIGGDRSLTFADALTNTGGTLTVNGKLAGGALIAGATTIYGIHAPGNAGVGSQTFQNDLSYGNGSIFEWDLNANSTASGFDTVTVSGNISVTGGIFKVVLGDLVDMETNAFWNTPFTTQTWSMSSIFGEDFASGGFSTVQTSEIVSQYGSFSISNTELTWTAVPEPGNAAVGLVLVMGLVRRRRKKS